MKNYLYEVVVGANVTVEDAPAVPSQLLPDGTASPEVAAVSHSEYKEQVDAKNVVANDVPSAMAKVALTEGQFYGSVTRMQEVNA